MANISRYHPLGDIDRVFDDLMKGFFVRPVRADVPEAIKFRMDVTENDKAYTVKAEMPGLKKEDIHVEIDGNQVAISAEVKRETEQKEGETVVHSERYYGRLYRAFALGQEVDEAGANAKYADGVLELTLPKKAATSAKRLAVQ
jgi:HSP20 family protein